MKLEETKEVYDGPFSNIGFRNSDYRYAENHEDEVIQAMQNHRFMRKDNYPLASEDRIINNLVDINGELHDSVRIDNGPVEQITPRRFKN